MSRKKIVKLLGNGLMLIAVCFIGYNLYQYREAIAGAFTWQIGGIMLLSAFIISCMHVVNGVLFARLVGRVSGGKVPMALTTSIYCKSSLYKYIPGNVLQYVGRNQIAEMSNIKHEQVAFASLLEIGIQAVGALVTALILARSYVIDWFGRQNMLLIIGVVAAALAVLAIVLIILKKKTNIYDELKCFLQWKNAGFLMLFLLYSVVYQIINGLIFVWLMHILVGGLDISYWGNAAGIYCFAWLIGYITPGAPGGIGIREALLSVLLANVVSPEMITTAVIFNRIVTVLGDLIAYPASLLLRRFPGEERH